LRAVEVFGRRETEMRGKDTESVSFWCCWVEREKKVKKKKKRGKSMALLQRAMSCLQREEERRGIGKWEVGGWRSGAVRIYTPLEWGGKEQINAKRRKNYKKAYAFS
jgi:hypothetical protein